MCIDASGDVGRRADVVRAVTAAQELDKESLIARAHGNPGGLGSEVPFDYAPFGRFAQDIRPAHLPAVASPSLGGKVACHERSEGSLARGQDALRLATLAQDIRLRSAKGSRS